MVIMSSSVPLRFSLAKSPIVIAGAKNVRNKGACAKNERSESRLSSWK